MNQEYIEFIKDNGIYLESKLGVKEWALSRDNAIRLLEIMNKIQKPCLGGDVILEEENGNFKYAYGFWHYDRTANETEEEYIGNSISKAVEYIKNYPEKEGNKYYYVIV